MSYDDVSKYVSRNPSNGIFRYYRRVPVEVSLLDTRDFVKTSLKTRVHADALARAKPVHEAVESYWAALLAGTSAVSALDVYEATVRSAQSLGFTYKPAHEVADLDVIELKRRLAIAEAHQEKSPAIEAAVIGLAQPPAPKLSDLWKLYEEHNRAGLLGMSPGQLDKHEVSRQRAIRYTQELLGDLELGKISRSDVLRFREWWTDKIEAEGLTAYSANRSFSDMKGMLTVIDNAFHTSYREAWDKARIKETNKTKLKKRLPFPDEWIQTKILAHGALDELNEDARLIVYTMIETGLRLGEVCNLRPQDIVLMGDVPHLEVAERDDRRQKSEHSIRRVPLVGVSLWAMKQRPDGFPKYQDKAGSASAIINKVMKSQKLRPTPRHTAYSFRHSFQDRIENAGCSDRMQADLMGHEFGRPKYGDGAEMKRRQAFLEGIKFVWPASVTKLPETS